MSQVLVVWSWIRSFLSPQPPNPAALQTHTNKHDQSTLSVVIYSEADTVAATHWDIWVTVV